MIYATRRIQFCAGHRVWKHESACAHLHGHNYVAFFHATATELDGLGRVVDFSVLKRKLGGWIEEHWDHGFILHRHDESAVNAVSSIPKQKLYLLDCNPTAENIAHHLLHVVAPQQLAGHGARVVKVVVWETENCFAEVQIPSEAGVAQRQL